MTYAGYTVGSNFISEINRSGLMSVLTKGASILGLIMIGGMTASTVTFTSVLSFPVSGSDPILLQTYLDSIFKGLVPLSLTLGCLFLLKKRVNINLIMFGVMGLAIVLALFGIV